MLLAEDGKLIGFNVLVGGGLAMTHGDNSTYPRCADDFGFIPKENTLDVAAAVVTTQRDWGNRVNRKNAKTKYTLDRVGADTFKAEVEERAGITFEDHVLMNLLIVAIASVGLKVLMVKNILLYSLKMVVFLISLVKPLKTGMLEIAKIHKGDFRLTANQNLIVAGVAAEDKAAIEKLARDHGLISDNVSNQRKSSMACVAFPTCPLAMAEAERYLPGLVDDVEAILEKNGLKDESIILTCYWLSKRLWPCNAC